MAKLNLTLGDTELIIATCKKHNLLRNQAAYVLASAYWETARTMKPVREAYWLSEDWRRRNLRYYPWYGRGYVQITWKDNYRRAGRKLGVDFIGDKEKVMEPRYAAEILVLGMKEGWFTGKRLNQYITLSRSDFKNARRIVNAMDKWRQIANLARAYDALLLANGYGVEEIKESTPEVVVEKPVEKPEKEIVPVPIAPEGMEKDLPFSKQVWSGILSLLTAVLSSFTDWRVQILLILVASGFAGFVIYDRWVKKNDTKMIKELLEGDNNDKNNQMGD